MFDAFKITMAFVLGIVLFVGFIAFIVWAIPTEQISKHGDNTYCEISKKAFEFPTKEHCFTN